jgi:P27 family predicted phage terminase small subunit
MLTGHRPPRNEPRYPQAAPDKPKKMSAGARKQWDELVREMNMVAVLRRVDRNALWQLCEDESFLAEAYEGLWRMAAALEKKAKAEGKVLAAGPIIALMTMEGGKTALNAVRDISTRVFNARREFGLSPAGRSYLNTGVSNPDLMNEIDDAIFFQAPQRLGPMPN